MALGLCEEGLERPFLEDFIPHGRAAEHQAIVFFEALDAAKRFYLEYIDIGAGLLGPLLDGPGHLQRIARAGPVNDCDLAH